MAVHLSPIGNAFQFLTVGGLPLNAGLLYTYAAGTSTPQATYTNSAGSIPNSNPIVLGVDGRLPAEVWLTDGQSYKFVLQTVLGITLGTYDNVSSQSDPTAILALLAAATAPTGASLIGYKSTATGAVSTTVNAKLQAGLDLIVDFGAIGNGVTDDTAATQAWLTASAGKVAKFPAGYTFLLSSVNVPANTVVDMYGASIKQKVLGNLVSSAIFVVNGNGCVFLGGSIDGQRTSQPVNGFSDSFNGGANGTGRAFRAAILADQVTFAGIQSLVVRGVTFTAQYGACVACRDVPNVSVEDCVATSTNFELAACYRSAATLVNALFTGNTCTSLGTGDPTVNADNLYAARYDRVVVANNRVALAERCLVKIESCAAVTITGNVCETNSTVNFAAIQVDGTNTAQYLVISDNAIYNFQSGILLSSGTYNAVSINGNAIYNTTGATGDGISVTTTLATGLSITDNTFYNLKRHGINIVGQVTGLLIANNNMSGQATAGSYGIVLTASVGSWTDHVIRGNILRNFEASAVGSGVFNFNRSAAFIFTNMVIQGNTILAGGAANRALRSPGIDLLTNGIISDNYIDGLVDLYSASIEHRNNTVTGVFSVPAGTANDSPIGATQTTIGANGAATAPTANPVGYTKKKVNGSTFIVPYYNP